MAKQSPVQRIWELGKDQHGRLITAVILAVVGVVGGIAGSIVSLMISWLIDIISIGQGFTWDAFKLAVFGGENITRLSIVPLWLILFAIVFSIFIGLVSGYYPANKAVKIPALEAIKSE